MADLAASLQATIIDILIDKLAKAVKQTGAKTVAIGGGVSANSGVRAAVEEFCNRRRLKALYHRGRSPQTRCHGRHRRIFQIHGGRVSAATTRLHMPA